MARDFNVDQIKKLWILELIIQTGSFKQAALQAKVTPSAVSQTLTSLESIIGKPLLIRDKTHIHPTPVAMQILTMIRPAFDAFEKLKDLNNYETPEISWINFGTYESVAIDILPGLISTFREKLPKTKLQMRIARTHQLLTMVRKGELCSALITEVSDLDRFYKKEVYTDELGFFVSKKHPDIQLGWKLIEKLGIGSLAPSKDGLPRYFTEFTKQLDSKYKPIILSESFETLRSAATSGTIVSILPKRVAHRLDDLTELMPPKNFKEKGTHKLLVVGQQSCDKDEINFLAMESKKLLNVNI